MQKMEDEIKERFDNLKKESAEGLIKLKKL